MKFTKTTAWALTGMALAGSGAWSPARGQFMPPAPPTSTGQVGPVPVGGGFGPTTNPGNSFGNPAGTQFDPRFSGFNQQFDPRFSGFNSQFDPRFGTGFANGFGNGFDPFLSGLSFQNGGGFFNPGFGGQGFFPGSSFAPGAGFGGGWPGGWGGWTPAGASALGIGTLYPGGFHPGGGAVMLTGFRPNPPAPRADQREPVRNVRVVADGPGAATLSARFGTAGSPQGNGSIGADARSTLALAGIPSQRVVTAAPDRQTAGRLVALMQTHPILTARVTASGTTSVRVRLTGDGGSVTREYALENVFFERDGLLRDAASTPGLLNAGDVVMVPEGLGTS